MNINGRNKPAPTTILVFDSVAGGGSTHTSSEYQVGDYTHVAVTSFTAGALVAYTELQVFNEVLQSWYPLWLEIFSK